MTKVFKYRIWMAIATAMVLYIITFYSMSPTFKGNVILIYNVITNTDERQNKLFANIMHKTH